MFPISETLAVRPNREQGQQGPCRWEAAGQGRSYFGPHSLLASTRVKPSAYFNSHQPQTMQHSGCAGGA